MGRTVRAWGTSLLAAGLLLGTAGCTSFAESSSDAEETTSASTTSSSAAETSESEEATTSASSTSASDDGVLDEEDEGRRLTLADFFAVTDFEERRYDVADQNDVQGIGATVQSCGGDGYVQQLELRLANNFSELTFSAAQANDSRNSDQELAVEVVGNNEQIDIRSVPFNEVQDFTVDVEGVNALVIRLYLDDAAEDCGGSVIGVITDATLN
ncbi:hypothetical protein ACI8AF_00620 [Blastococcus sp. SYSU D00669]